MSDQRDRLLAAVARAEQAVDDLCQGRLRWEMRVPAEPDHDPDLIISEALRQAREFAAGVTVGLDVERLANAYNNVLMRRARHQPVPMPIWREIAAEYDRLRDQS